MLTVKLWPAAIVLVLLASAVLAAVTVTYLNNSTVSVTTVEAPVRYAAGTETANRYVTGWSLSNNETYFAATIKGVPEVNLTIDHIFKFENHDTAAHTVTLTLTGGVVANAQITTFKVHFKDSADDSTVAVWDLKASASQSFANMPAADNYYGVVYIHLASGAGNNNVAESLAVSLTVA